MIEGVVITTFDDSAALEELLGRGMVPGISVEIDGKKVVGDEATAAEPDRTPELPGRGVVAGSSVEIDGKKVIADEEAAVEPSELRLDVGILLEMTGIEVSVETLLEIGGDDVCGAIVKICVLLVHELAESIWKLSNSSKVPDGGDKQKTEISRKYTPSVVGG
jgi:hypothetical protein